MLVTPWIWFVMMNTKSYTTIFFAFLVLLLPQVATLRHHAGVLHACIPAADPLHRYVAGLQPSGTIIGGGLSPPLIATALLGKTNNWPAGVAIFITALNLIALLATFGLRERHVAEPAIAAHIPSPTTA